MLLMVDADDDHHDGNGDADDDADDDQCGDCDVPTLSLLSFCYLVITLLSYHFVTLSSLSGTDPDNAAIPYLTAVSRCKDHHRYHRQHRHHHHHPHHRHHDSSLATSWAQLSSS